MINSHIGPKDWHLNLRVQALFQWDVNLSFWIKNHWLNNDLKFVAQSIVRAPDLWGKTFFRMVCFCLDLELSQGHLYLLWQRYIHCNSNVSLNIWLFLKQNIHMCTQTPVCMKYVHNMHTNVKNKTMHDDITFSACEIPHRNKYHMNEEK